MMSIYCYVKESFNVIMPYIKVKKRKIYYEKHGTGMPVLFCHSLLWDKSMWDHQISKLKNHFCCIIPELWGHGSSNILFDKEYSLELLAADHKAFMDELSIDKYAIVGSSIGGMLGTYLSLAYPEKVSKLVLMASYVGEEPPEKQQLYFEMMDVITQYNLIPDELIEKIIPIFFSKHTLENNTSLVDMFRTKLKTLPRENLSTIMTLGRCVFSRKSILNKLPNLKVPTSIIVGRHDMARPIRESQQMASLIPNSEFNIIEDSGHICNAEQPEIVNQLLYDFLFYDQEHEIKRVL